MNKEELKTILDSHDKWLNGEAGGERANLWRADLSNADLSNADLSNADLSNADLSNADLSNTDFSDAILMSANLQGANLSGAILSDAILRRANLSNANLSGAELWATAGNSKEIKSLFVSEIYPIIYTSEYLQIGCERHLITDWWEFDNTRIEKMDGETALVFWAEWKDTIKMIIEKSPAAGIKK